MTHATHGDGHTTAGSVIHWARLYDLGNRLFGLGDGRHRRSLDLAGVQRGERVLDIGCGPGTLAILAAKRSGPEGEVQGIDPSEEMIDLAQKKSAKAGVHARFQTGVAERLPFPDSSFDVVLSSLMLHHLPDDVKSQALREVARVLKPGGRLLAVDMSGGGPWYWRLATSVIRHRLPKDYVERLMRTIDAAGLAPELLQTDASQFAFIRAAKPAGES
jgi:demethylmenaquinone methyltransferase/2-methoxy-6-polyprenyl-1,4-benzoquinol methylase/phosphoethanolamine N-methyltransferase